MFQETCELLKGREKRSLANNEKISNIIREKTDNQGIAAEKKP